MRCRTYLLVAVTLFASVAVHADKKSKKVLPDFVLKAQTVTVVIQPDAQEPMSDPNANMKVQQEVEKALMKWGRFRLAVDVQAADLVVAVRKGTGKTATPTVGGGPVDTRPVILEGSDNSIRIGGHQGTPPAATQDPTPDSGRTHEGVQMGGSVDTMRVYQGGVEYPLDAPAIWSYTGKDALKSPDVKAMEEFRKAIEEAEKVAQQKQQQSRTTKKGSGGQASKP